MFSVWYVYVLQDINILSIWPNFEQFCFLIIDKSFSSATEHVPF